MTVVWQMASKQRTLISCAAVVGGLLSLATPVSAQYFGRNKVQYNSFDFQVLKTEHFDIYFYPSEREGIDIAARMAERWHARLERVLEHTLRGRQPLVLVRLSPRLRADQRHRGRAERRDRRRHRVVRRRIVLPLGGPLADTDHVIGHELVHAFQFDIDRPGPHRAPGRSGLERLPLWFIEGMAEYLSIGPVDPNTAMWLRDAAQQEKLPTVDDLDNPKYFPYRWGQAFWAYVAGRWGDEVVAADAGRRRRRPARSTRAIEQVLGVDAEGALDGVACGDPPDLRADPGRHDSTGSRSARLVDRRQRARAAT